MAVPSKVAGGGGDNDNAKCLKATFSTALASAPKIEAWDNDSTYPLRDISGMTTAHEIFTGTTDNGFLPCLAGWSGGSEANDNLPGSNWHPPVATPGSDNPNLLKGSTNYVTCTNTPGAAGNIIFNLSLKIADDMYVPSTSSMAHIIQIRYTYTGVSPSVIFYYNDGGNETTPVWTGLTPGTHGIKFCNAGTAPPTYTLTMAGAGLSFVAPEVWVTL
jgi:hypothetical protein